MKRTIKPLVLILLLFSVVLPHITSLADEIREMIRVAVYPGNEPYQYLDAEGNICGFHIDLFNAISAKLNLEPIYYVTQRESFAFDALENGDVDIVLGANSSASDREYLSLSEPLFVSSISLVVDSKTATRLNSGETGLIYSIIYESHTVPSAASYYKINLAACYSKNITRVSFSDQNTTFQHLINGSASAALLEKNGALYKLKRSGLQDAYVIFYNNIASISYTILSLPLNSALMSCIDLALFDLRQSGIYEQLWSQYKTDTVSKESQFFLQYRKALYSAAAIICISALAVIIWNRTLRRKVQQKVNELSLTYDKLIREQESLAYESKLRSLMIELEPNGILLARRDGSVIQMNEASIKIFSISRKMGVFNLRNSFLGASILGSPQKTQLESNMPLLEKTTTYMDRIYQYSVVPLPKEVADEQLLITISDITAKVREGENLMEAEKNRLLNTLVSGIAHEIRNPLMVIKNYAQLLTIRKGDERMLETFAEVIPKEADRINRLVEDLITFTKKNPVQKQTIDISAVLEDSIRFVKIDLDRVGITITKDIEAGLNILANSDRMRQVFINILINARQAIEMQKAVISETLPGLIQVHSFKKNNEINIIITDNGCGMQEEDLIHVTEPFYTTKTKGTGLGMAVSMRFIEESHGTIQYESSFGKGTIVKIVFSEAQNE